MSARAIGSGTVSFGLVSIPIKLYSTNEPSEGISFNLLHGKCNSRLKQQYTCPKDNEIVERADMVKGYEFAKGQYVVFSAEELKAIEEQSTGAIEITEFVPSAKVDPVYYDKAYYLGPDKGGEKAYRLLREAMGKTGRVALAKYAARGKQYLVMVRPLADALVLQQLRYAEEVKSLEEVPIDKVDIKDVELKLAVQLVEQISSDEFKPQQYQDDVKKRVQELIQRKVEGEEVTSAPAEEPQAKIIDLMEALKASLGPAKGAKGKQEAERKPPRRAANVSGRSTSQSSSNSRPKTR